MDDRRYEKILARAFNLLAAKPRSVAEMRTRLLEKEWATDDLVGRVIDRLLELGYLNDRQFAEHYVVSRLAVKPLGRARLRRNLQEKRISSADITVALEEAYSEDREDNVIDQAIARRLRLRGVPQTREDSRKLLEHLVRLGFSYDLAISKIRKLPNKDELIED